MLECRRYRCKFKKKKKKLVNELIDIQNDLFKFLIKINLI